MFTITWRIKNFSMCPMKSEQPITSPVFRIPEFGNSEWSLRLEPELEGEENKICIGCFLRNESLGDNKSMKVSFKICVYPSTEEHSYIDFGFNEGWGYAAFCLADILKEKCTYLPNDTLTLKCSMEFKDLGNSNEMKENKIKTLARDFLQKTSYNIKECHIETVISVHTKSITWPVESFLSLAVYAKLVFPVDSAFKKMPSFYVTLYKNAESSPSIKITQKDPLSKSLFVKCSVSVVNGPTDVNYCISDEFLFTSDEVWILPPFLKWYELEEKGYFKHTDGTLYMEFDFAFSIRGQTNHYEKFQRYRCIPFKRPGPVEELTVPTTNEDQAVVTLRAGDQNFVVHKAVLKARSEVFSVMFNIDMKEKETGVVDIPDIDPKTLGQMIAFLYSGTTTGNLSTSDVKKLYAIGHKYQVRSLMDYCSSILISSLSASNVCDVLEFSDLYQNRQLLKYAEDFVIVNPDSHRFLLSQDWKNFMKKNVSLAAKIMYKMLVQ